MFNFVPNFSRGAQFDHGKAPAGQYFFPTFFKISRVRAFRLRFEVRGFFATCTTQSETKAAGHTCGTPQQSVLLGSKFP